MAQSEKNNKLIIRKANELVMARYKLTIMAQRLLLVLFSKIQKNDDTFHRYDLSIEQIYEVLNLKKSGVEERKKRLVQTLETLQKNILKIVNRTEGGDVLKMTAWIEAPTIKWDNDSLTLRLAEHLKEYLLGLDFDFTAYPYDEVIQFQSEYGFRLYEMCKNFHARGNFNKGIEDGHYIHKEEFTIERFREIVGVPPKRYRRIYDFQKRVLKAAQKEVGVFCTMPKITRLESQNINQDFCRF